MWADSQHPPVDSHTGLMSIHGEWVTPNGQTYLLSGCVLDCVHTQESIVVGQTSGWPTGHTRLHLAWSEVNALQGECCVFSWCQLCRPVYIYTVSGSFPFCIYPLCALYQVRVHALGGPCPHVLDPDVTGFVGWYNYIHGI